MSKIPARQAGATSNSSVYIDRIVPTATGSDDDGDVPRRRPHNQRKHDDSIRHDAFALAVGFFLQPIALAPLRHQGIVRLGQFQTVSL